jgi:hypothetical protein
VTSFVLEGTVVNDQIHKDSFLGAQTFLPARVMLHIGEREPSKFRLGAVTKVTGGRRLVAMHDGWASAGSENRSRPAWDPEEIVAHALGRRSSAVGVSWSGPGGRTDGRAGGPCSRLRVAHSRQGWQSV